MGGSCSNTEEDNSRDITKGQFVFAEIKDRMQIQALTPNGGVDAFKDSRNSVVKIEVGGSLASGFFLKFRALGREILSVVSCQNVINADMIKNKSSFKISYNRGEKQKEIALDDSRMVFSFEKEFEDVTIVQLFPGEVEDDLFLEPATLYRTQGPQSCLNKPILIYHHPRGGPLVFSMGTIIGYNKNYDYFFAHDVSTEPGSAGSPVILSEGKVIGVHRAGNTQLKIKYGTFIEHVIKKINTQKEIFKEQLSKNQSTIEGGVVVERGNVFVPEIKDGKETGKGKLYNPDGKLIYDGEFRNYKPNGKGVEYDPTTGKIKYEGTFKDGQPEKASKK